MKKYLFLSLFIILLILIGVVFLYTQAKRLPGSFCSKTTPDIAYYNILNWDKWNRGQLNAKIEILSKTPVSNISQKVTVKDTTFIFNWEFKKSNDSITLVRAYVSDPDRKLYNRLTVPFINTRFKQGVRRQSA